MVWNSRHHDLGITNVGSAGAGTTVEGMMLAQKEDGTPAYEEFDGSYLANQFFTGLPSQDYTNPEEEIILSQDDWRSGFGLEYFDSNDPKRYYSSINVDARNRGMVLCSNTPTGIDVPGWVSPTGFTAGTWADEANAYDGNTGTAATITVGATSTSDAIELTFPSMRCSGCRIYKSHTDTVTTNVVSIFYGAAWHQVVSKSATTQNSWINFVWTGQSAVTKIKFTFYNSAVGNNTISLKDVDVFGGAAGGPIVAHAEFNSLLYAITGGFLVKLDGTGAYLDLAGATALTNNGVLGATATDMEVMTISGTCYLFIALGTSTDYRYFTPAEDGATSNAAVKRFNFFTLVHTTAPTMYGSDSTSTIRSTVNPLNAGTAWSDPATTVGSSHHAITGMFQKGGALYIPKTNMPYYLDSTGAVQNDLAPRCQALTASTSGKNALTDGQIIMYPVGAQGLLEIDGTTLTWRNPSNYCTNLSSFVGRVQALGYDEAWWFAVVDNSTKVEVLAGRLETIDGTTSWVWHPINEITLTNCETAWVSSIYKKRLWVASTTAGESLYYIDLPTGYGDIVNDANKKFLTGGTFETPWLHGNFRADNKSWIKLTLTMGHTYNANRYFTVEYKVLGGSYVSIGNFTGSATSMVQSRFIDTTNKPFSSMVRFRFTAVTNDTDYTPVLLNYDARAVMYPNIKRMIHCVVRCSNEVVRKDGVIEKAGYAITKATLDNARANAVWPISVRDIDGSTIYVKFLPVPRDLKRMIITRKEKGRVMERQYHVLMMQVPLS